MKLHSSSSPWFKGVSTKIPTGFLHQQEEARQFFLVTAFTVVAVIYVLIFGIESYFMGHQQHAALLFGMVPVFIINYLILKYSGEYRFCSNVIVLLIGLMVLIFLITGGVEQTGPLWIFIYPVMALYIRGLKYGLISVLIFTLCCFVLLFYPDIPFSSVSLTGTYKIRLMGVYSAVTLLACLTEFARERAQQAAYLLMNQMEQTSRTDEITDLPNRRHMSEILNHEASRFQRTLRPFSIILCYIDGLSRIKEHVETGTSDLLIKNIAKLLSDSLRNHDYIARWGNGADFLILLPETPSNECHQVASRMMQSLSESPFVCEDKRIKLTMSFGYATAHPTQNSGSIESLMETSRMYLGKAMKNGGNKVVGSESLTEKI